jgi:P27 family predicted phage terminase small subunit
MGKRGPPPTPTALKILNGNPGHRPLNKNEPTPPECKKLPPPPSWLQKLATIEWKRLGPELVELGLLTVVDLTQFAAYCEAYADMIEASKLIDDEGRTFTTEGRCVIQHPAVGMKNRAMEIMRKFASDFGCSPSSRTSIDVSIGGAKKSGGLPARKRG